MSSLAQPVDARAWWRPVHPAVEVATTVPTPPRGLAFDALVAFTAILLLSPQIWFPLLGTLRIAFIAAGLAIATHLLQSWTGRQAATPFFPEIGIVFAL